MVANFDGVLILYKSFDNCLDIEYSNLDDSILLMKQQDKDLIFVNMTLQGKVIKSIRVKEIGDASKSLIKIGDHLIFGTSSYSITTKYYNETSLSLSDTHIFKINPNNYTDCLNIETILNDEE
jgi:hypothetical protein